MEKKPKVRELVAELVPDRFGTSLHFNRFGIERLDVATAVHFGLFNNDDELLATYSCVLFNEYLDRCEKEWLDYLGKIGTPKAALETTWRPSASRISKIEPVTAWFLARNGDEAEIRCYTHSLGDVLSAGRSENPEKVRAYPTALLKSSLETQKLLIVGLFAG